MCCHNQGVYQRQKVRAERTLPYISVRVPGTVRQLIGEFRRNDRVGDYVVVDGLHNGRSLCGRLITWLKSVMEEIMDWNRVQGSWKQLEGKIKAKWGKLTADDLTTINGRREELEGKIQQRYGVAKDEARKEIDDWFTSQGF